MAQQQIDQLLERYLSLLDEYTRLRESLSQLQSGVYQNIARANFSGERGMRYGQDHYDGRMQALRLLDVSVDEQSVPSFTIVEAPKEEGEATKEKDTEKTDDVAEEQEPSEAQTEKTKAKEKKQKKVKNPIHWFGLFAPMPLRTAQTQSIQAVEEIIPRLVSVNAEMLNVEIEVRRARKRRAKAEAAAGKDTETTLSTVVDTSKSNQTPVQAA